MYFWAIASTWPFTSRARALAWRSRACVVVGLDEPLEVVQRKLRVHGDERVVQPDDGIDALAAAEAVLEIEPARGEDVREEVREQDLADAAARLRRAQQLLEALEILRALAHLRCRLVDLAEALVDLRRGLRHPGQAPVDLDVELAEAAVDLRVELAEAPVHRLGHSGEPPVDVRVAARELLGVLSAQAVELGAQHADEPDGGGGERRGEKHEENDGPDHGPTNVRTGVGRRPPNPSP